MSRQRRRLRSGQSIAAFVIGAVAGGVAGLFLAPQSGHETARRVLRSAKRVRAFARRKAIRLRQAALHEAQSIQRSAIREIGRTKRIVSRKTDRLCESAVHGMGQARSWVEGQMENGHRRLANGGHHRIANGAASRRTTSRRRAPVRSTRRRVSSVARRRRIQHAHA